MKTKIHLKHYINALPEWYARDKKNACKEFSQRIGSTELISSGKNYQYKQSFAAIIAIMSESVVLPSKLTKNRTITNKKQNKGTNKTNLKKSIII